MWLALLQGATLGFTASAQPGPLQALLLGETMRRGWRQTLPAALAPLLSDTPIVVVALLVLTQAPEGFLRGLQIAGGLFILYLAGGGWRSLRQPAASPVESTPPQPGWIWRAALMNLLNPNPWIFWVTVSGPIVVAAWRSAPFDAVAFMLAFYALLIGGLAGFILLFGLAARLGPRVTRSLSLVAAVALAGFGLFQLAQGLLG
jgi:threonine/homoserine/homoserine lactone efflux protein